LKRLLATLAPALLAGCFSNSAIIENVNPEVPGSRFRVIATIAGGDANPDLRMSVTVRQQLNEGGWSAVRRAGRWESERAAVVDICAVGDVDGVLIVSYNRLELDDCESLKPAYRIDGSPDRGVGLTEMTTRLIRYLRGQDLGPMPR
jgi:hypothetical protein